MAVPKGSGEYSRPTFNQAKKIIAKFGGEGRLAALLGVHRTTVYRWGWEPPIGTDGLIPSRTVKKIQALARRDGVLLTTQDWTPEKIKYEDENGR